MEASQGDTLLYMFVVWSAVTAVLIILLIVRSRLSAREADQLFLDPAEDSMVLEQSQIISRMDRLKRPIGALIVLSSLLLVAMASLWVWRALHSY